MYQTVKPFLSDKAFEQLLDARRNNEFKDITNPADGVSYPRICDEIPDLVREEVEFLAGKPCNFLFMRESPAGVHVPHQVHTDNSMGATSMMLYLEDGPGGTAFLRHATLGIQYAPAYENLVEACRIDANDPDRWIVNAVCEQKENMACIFDAGYFHRAEPVGGYGTGVESRCVLTAFFG